MVLATSRIFVIWTCGKFKRITGRQKLRSKPNAKQRVCNYEVRTETRVTKWDESDSKTKAMTISGHPIHSIPRLNLFLRPFP